MAVAQAKPANCYCDSVSYRRCVYCEDAERIAEEDKVCKSWAWNCTPRECAQEANELDWVKRHLEAAMYRNGFKKDDVESVLYEFEIGE